MNNNNNIPQQKLNVRKFLFKALHLWYIILIFLFVSASLAYLNYMQTAPQYLIRAKLLMSNAGESPGSKITEGDRALPGITLGRESEFENQSIILTSRNQIKNTLNQLDFNISYYKKEPFHFKEIYKESPFTAIIDSSGTLNQNMEFSIEFISKDGFIVSDKKRDFKKEGRFFHKIIHPEIEFSLIPNDDIIEGSNYDKNSYKIVFNSMDNLINRYQSKIVLERVQPGSSVINISLEENNRQKGIDFLNQLQQSSVQYTLDKKNQIALNTINFIENQLIGVADSLGAAENVLENFRSRNQIMDVSYQAQSIITQSQNLERQKAEIKAKLDYYSYLKDYIQNNRNVQEIVAPSSIGIEDPVLSQQISQLSLLNAERSSMLFNATTENPHITRLNNRVANLKESILETINSVQTTTNLTLSDINNRLVDLSHKISGLPKTEQRLLSIERTRQINSENYTYLLNRLAEAQLAKASNTPDNEIVEDAIVAGKTAPDLTHHIIVVILTGILLPLIIIFIKVLSNKNIEDEEDIKSISSIPIIGEIPYSKNGEIASNNKKDNTNKNILEESFRTIRTSLNFYDPLNNNKTILITSILPGEGKSFCSINLANSYAILNKKTVLIEYDMRKPSFNKNKQFKDLPGLSGYYTGDHSIDDIIIKSESNNTPDIITAGSIPPNPCELIDSDATDKLFGKLKTIYDIIIIDTPPVGVVSDAYLLTKQSGLTLMVLRHNKTPKPLLEMNLEDEKTKKAGNIAFILNGIPFDRKEYSYKYGYTIKNSYFKKAAV
ncbi:polysaccharide biosynthesis tyrosine autokinase [Marinilabiliaceae bacterium ANBcel2]|nr:polysaccharide biosynthesis tyrosine autokinase [Marinilabiliaceae bacterium ANBcel2]